MINVPVGILVASICDLLEENLAPNLTYHCLGHTVAVMESATLIAQQEGFSTDEQALLQLAAAFHDSGFCIMRQANEPVGAYLLTSALYHTQSKKTPEPSLNKIDGAAELAKLPMNDYRNKCTAMKNKLIEKIGRQQASQIEVSAAARDVSYVRILCTRHLQVRRYWIAAADFPLRFRFCQTFHHQQTGRLLSHRLSA